MYVTYKITNKITGEYYIGSHKTDNPYDDYMGSGKLIRKSVEEYGIENHEKQILGVFDNRESSIELEHSLIKEKKNNGDSNILNKSFGGFSFDYINDNLVFDRASFGKMASHESSHEEKRERIRKYNESPVLCLFCKKPIPYEKRYNKFCSSSCSASYNNPIKKRKERQPVYCQTCGKEITQIYRGKNNYKRKFCCANCRVLFYRKLSPLRAQLLNDKEKIITLHNDGMPYRKIAILYKTSANTIKDLLKNRLDN